MSSQGESEASDGALESGSQELPAKDNGSCENIQGEADKGEEQTPEQNSVLEKNKLPSPSVTNENSSEYRDQDVEGPKISNKEVEDSKFNNQDTEVNNQEVEDPEVNNQEVEDPEVNNQEVQDPEVSGPEVHDAELGDQDEFNENSVSENITNESSNLDENIVASVTEEQEDPVKEIDSDSTALPGNEDTYETSQNEEIADKISDVELSQTSDKSETDVCKEEMSENKSDGVSNLKDEIMSENTATSITSDDSTGKGEKSTDEPSLLTGQVSETLDDTSTSNSKLNEDGLLAESEDKSNSLPAEDKDESEGMGMELQIAAVTGGDDVGVLDKPADDSEKNADEADTEMKDSTAKDAGEDEVAMEAEDSGLPTMVISEPRTLTEDKMEIGDGDADTAQNGETDNSEKMEVTENGETKSSNTVENVISENDSTGFKILSVSEAKDAEEITLEDDADIKTVDNQDKTSEAQKSKDAESKDSTVKDDDSGPKIVETTSLSDTPQRVTRSQTGSMPTPPKITPPVLPKTDSPGIKSAQRCIVCGKVGKCKYNIVRNGDVKHLCNDRCFKSFRSMPTKYLRADKTAAPSTPTPAQSNVAVSKYKTCCVCQLMNVNPAQPFLNWSSMDFCGEDCLNRYKKQMKSTCGQCSKTLPQAQWATFCLKVGNEVKQFCNSECYLTYKGKAKVCAYCKKDASHANGKYKDCCSSECMSANEKDQDEDIEIIGIQPGSKEVACAVCKKVTKPKHELTFEGKLHKMCSDPCYSAFQYANKLTSNTCDNCGVYCYGEGSSPQFIQFEGHQKRFCGTKCVNTFRTANKKMVQCAWCGLRKTNFDMIERVDANNKYQLFCSLNCLSLYRVNLQATSNQSVTCDQCRKFVPAQYHLTMSDASVRNFCSYTCVMTFQGQFGAGKQPPPKKNTATPAVPAKQNSVDTRTSPRAIQAKTSTMPTVPSNPIISSVTTLAPTAVDNRNQPQTVNIKSQGQMPLVINAGSPQVKTTTTGTQQQIIIQPPPPKQVKNKSLLCKPYVQTKATSCRPSTQTKETSTDPVEQKPIFIPVPVPIYIPTPMAMYSCPTPIPIPIPVPVPIPCFIPTTKKSAASILKHIKEIQDRIPADPFEAELLRMAEAVATAEKGSDDESDKSDEEMAVDDVVDGKDPLAAKQSVSDHEEDMLQMALRMASEMSEPADLESVVDPLPINSNSASEVATPVLVPEEDVEQLLSPRERRARNRKTTTKRSSTSKATRRSKRQRVESESEVVAEPQEEPAAPATKGAAPDASFLLKYMYGVNAWKHWVVQKNTQLEKVMKQGSGRVKFFKTELLQCTADELNYSLCLFVKEVRKPNGDEYAADSILYLCLGVQNYLFENGRIDNIFTDIYYEKFTECLNEVVQRFKPKLNASGQLVCRIEEEHLWECKQLGAHSPHVLLNTLIYFNTKYFMLRTADDHMKLSFSHIMKHWKKNPGAPSIPGSKSTVGRSVYLRYYAGQPAKTGDSKDKKKKEEQAVLEQSENLDNPLRCPVKLYEFYLSKCSYFSSPESLKSRNDIFYLVPERSCVPDSPVWYSTQPMPIEPMAKMLHRIHLVKEVQEVYANIL